jgi:hypothetical protein
VKWIEVLNMVPTFRTITSRLCRHFAAVLTPPDTPFGGGVQMALEFAVGVALQHVRGDLRCHDRASGRWFRSGLAALDELGEC